MYVLFLFCIKFTFLAISVYNFCFKSNNLIVFIHIAISTFQNVARLSSIEGSRACMVVLVSQLSPTLRKVGIALSFDAWSEKKFKETQFCSQLRLDYNLRARVVMRPWLMVCKDCGSFCLFSCFFLHILENVFPYDFID